MDSKKKRYRNNFQTIITMKNNFHGTVGLPKIHYG